jgi:hypothetical protein
LVAVAVAVSSWDAGTSAVVDGAGSVADPAVIELANAVVYVIANAVAVGIGRAIAATVAKGVELVSFTVAVSSRDARASAVVDGSGSVADSAVIELADAVVYVVADTIAVGIGRTIATAVAKGVELVSFTVAVSGWDARAAAVINGARSVADSAVIELANAVVYVIANAVAVGIGRAIAATVAKGVELVSVAIAVSSWDA